MFKQMSQDDDPKTVLSLTIGEIHWTQQQQTCSTDGNPSELLQNSAKNKRQRCPDGPRLTVGIGSSLTAINPTYGGEECYRDNPHPTLDLFHRNTASGGSFQQYVNHGESAARSTAKRQAVEAVNTELKSENEGLKKIVRHLLAILRKQYTRAPSVSRSYSSPL